MDWHKRGQSAQRVELAIAVAVVLIGIVAWLVRS
jgi:hypothetical protein